MLPGDTVGWGELQGGQVDSRLALGNVAIMGMSVSLIIAMAS